MSDGDVCAVTNSRVDLCDENWPEKNKHGRMCAGRFTKGSGRDVMRNSESRFQAMAKEDEGSKLFNSAT
jgi:hypothetical protein